MAFLTVGLVAMILIKRRRARQAVMTTATTQDARTGPEPMFKVIPPKTPAVYVLLTRGQSGPFVTLHRHANACTLTLSGPVRLER